MEELCKTFLLNCKGDNSVKRQSNNNIKFCRIAPSTASSTQSSNQQYLLTFSCYFHNNKVAKLWWNILLTHVSGKNNKIDAVSRSSQLWPSHHAWIMLLHNLHQIFSSLYFLCKRMYLIKYHKMSRSFQIKYLKFFYLKAIWIALAISVFNCCSF
jgi:hypothetical protein